MFPSHEILNCNCNLGGWNVAQYFDTILKYDGSTETWSQVGTLKDTRGGPGVAIVDYDEMKKYCIQSGQQNRGIYHELKI